MNSRWLSIPLLRTSRRRASNTDRLPSTAIIVAVFVALSILFLWLQQIVAMQIEERGRQIQIKTEELQKLERSNDMLSFSIADAESQRNMAKRAADLLYGPQKPIYLYRDQPLSPPTGMTGEGQVGAAGIIDGAEPTTQRQSVRGDAGGMLNAGEEAETAP